MKQIRVALMCMVALFGLTPTLVLAEDSQPQIIISQFKITANDGQFFMLFNNTTQDIDMGTVQLVYYNHFDYAQASSSKIIGLTGTLKTGAYYLVNDGPYNLCHQLTVNSVSLGLSSTRGSVQVTKLEQAYAGQPIQSSVQDSVSWSKAAASGIPKLPSDNESFLYRIPLDENNNPSIANPGTGEWKTARLNTQNSCEYTSEEVSDGSPPLPVRYALLQPTPPPVRIVQLFRENTSPAKVNKNSGLMAPVINEILPNPAEPLSDSEDEFVEIYNPNPQNFDLTDFYLETGTTTKRKWKFPDGMTLPPQSFSLFTSKDFSISLSNSGGQLKLIGPDGTVVSETKEYGKAKDNYAWALADSEWYWTTTPTPGEANIMSAGESSGGSAAQTIASSGQLLGAFTNSNTPNSAIQNASQNPHVTTLHPSSLASVAVLAVGYGAYEYKQDIANKYRQLRSYRAARRKNR